MADSNRPAVHRGLKDLCFDRSPTTFIDGRAGELRYRGYSIHDLAAYSSFEETAYLLLYGELPTAAELAVFDAELKEARELPGAVRDIIRTVKDSHPMDVLRTAVSALAAFDPETDDKSPEATRRKGLRLTSQVPMIVTAHHHIRQGRDPVAASADLGHAANFLYMLKGEAPSEDASSLMDTDMVLHAEHGSNASSFTARVVVSTDANLYAAITAAVAALSGPAHGGAAENVMTMAREIGDPSKAAAYVKAKRKAREPIMGFGHRVYRAEDPTGAPHARGGPAALRGDGTAALVRDSGSARGGDAPLRPARHQRERGLLRRRRLSPARSAPGSVRAHLRHRPHPGLDGAGDGAVREQHPDPPAPPLHRPRAREYVPIEARG